MRVDAVVSMVLVQDLDRALRFYRDVLGFTVEAEEEDWVQFQEPVGLMLSPEPLPPDNMNFNAVTLALMVPDVQSAYSEMIERGVAFMVLPTEESGTIVAAFRDPDGNLIQLVQIQHAHI